jgi:hypothetical protein
MEIPTIVPGNEAPAISSAVVPGCEAHTNSYKFPLSPCQVTKERAKEIQCMETEVEALKSVNNLSGK